jgi:hypothetical protein
MGAGFDTLSAIPVKDPSKVDQLLGNWVDGKPNGKETSTNGDGTVLASSVNVNGAINTTLNQTHAGLVNSSDGMTAIFNFLNNSAAAVPFSFTNPVDTKSALVVIGYPANFWVTDGSGNSKKDKNGMVAFINPSTGKFKLNLLPNSPNTLFVIGQLLPNGTFLYKEYNFKGYSPLTKTLNFSLQNPNSDILQ